MGVDEKKKSKNFHWKKRETDGWEDPEGGKARDKFFSFFCFNEKNEKKRFLLFLLLCVESEGKADERIIISYSPRYLCNSE